MSDLSSKRCLPCEAGIKPLQSSEVDHLLLGLPGWSVNADYTEIHREFSFKNFSLTMAFVNAVAWIAHQENHHPDMTVRYNCCTIRYTTHAIQGLSENDFICAGKAGALLSL
jgi:4a-hydroxytetrahydrobiopterin dehydratase